MDNDVERPVSRQSCTVEHVDLDQGGSGEVTGDNFSRRPRPEWRDRDDRLELSRRRIAERQCVHAGRRFDRWIDEADHRQVASNWAIALHRRRGDHGGQLGRRPSCPCAARRARRTNAARRSCGTGAARQRFRGPTRSPDPETGDHRRQMQHRRSPKRAKARSRTPKAKSIGDRGPRVTQKDA